MKTPDRYSLIVTLTLIVVMITAGCRKPVAPPNRATTAPTPSETMTSDFAPPATTGDVYFKEVASTAGLHIAHQTGAVGKYFFGEIMCSGAALLDYDRDGDLDIYLVNGGELPAPDQNSARTSEGGRNRNARNRLLQQQEPGKFADVTETAGVGDTGYGMGAAVGDVNNDGYPDLYVTNFAADRLYLNQADGTFRDITKTAEINNPRWASSACFLDFDRDGRLDLYVANYVDYFAHACLDRAGNRDYCGPNEFGHTPDKLYRNVSVEGEVRFQDVSLSSGIARSHGPGLGVVAADVDDDGWIDIYVANDQANNNLWMNQQDGTFTDQAVLQGVAYDELGRAQAGMGVAVADLNDDRQPDFLVTHLAGESHAMYVSQQPAGYRDLTTTSGIASASFSSTGFGAGFFDVNHDGLLDLAVANGGVKRPDFKPTYAADASVPAALRVYAQPNSFWLGESPGRFRAVRAEGSFSQHVEVTRGLCLGDIDNDGDVDMLLSNGGSPPRLFENVADKKGHWLLIRAVLPDAGGRDAIGARITVVADDRSWTRWISPSGSYLSSHDPRAHIGLGDIKQVDAIHVRWPDGSDETFSASPADRIIEVSQGQGRR